ncbi:DUF305 domain-containing protein [Nonomuraea africana]|uniref:Uncharacterized protein (DUF305 family) n=1 Tax=Nonomuraea africana TaxID=46171 RepID=A0ABR9KAL9_9ACTN|nr:DUF305 domain-containing protein [Nonomuraea africana]MBE1559055.1 uncharacterized protein (DUF305 family) [Nonomuraea africana]
MSTNRAIIRRLAFTVAAGSGALALLTACGGTDNARAGHEIAITTHGAPASPQPGASFNEADVTFAQNMIPHHQQAVEMADLAETRAADAEVKKLAAKIKAAQDPEIQTLEGWLEAWDKPMPSGGMHHGMPGMMSAEDMKKLEAAQGAAFDRQFLRMMIAHHEGAIEMAKTEQAKGANDGVKVFAKTIESSQQAEVEQMRKLLDRL